MATALAMPGGRQTEFDPEIATQICELIVQGYTVREIDALPEMPCKTTVFKWLSQQQEFANQYARAKEFRAEDMGDEIVEIADDARNDWMQRKLSNGEVIDVPDNEVVNRSRLRVDTRKWLMGKLKPKVYGEVQRHEHTGADGGPITHVIEERRRLAGDLLGQLMPPTIEHDATTDATLIKDE